MKQVSYFEQADQNENPTSPSETQIRLRKNAYRGYEFKILFPKSIRSLITQFEDHCVRIETISLLRGLLGNNISKC